MTPPKCIAIVSLDHQIEEEVRYLVPGKYSLISVGEKVEALFGTRAKMVLFVQGKKPSDNLRTLQAIFQVSPQIPVLVLARSPEPHEIIQAFGWGVREYLLHPFQAEELTAKLDKHLQGKGLPGWFIGQWQRLRAGMKRKKAFPKKVRPTGLMPARLNIPHEAPLPAPGDEADLYVHFFGPFEVVSRREQLPEISGCRPKALLAYMVYHRQKHLHRELLMEEFWPETPSRSARNSLNVAISTIRRHFRRHFRAGAFILFKNEGYQFNPRLKIQTDVDHFTYWWETGRTSERMGRRQQAFEAFQQAALLYRGEFLEDLPYENWTLALRENLRETFLQILKNLSDYHFQSASYQEAAHLFQKILEIDPCLEDVHRRLMFIYLHLGQRDRMLRQYQRCAEALSRELGTAPSPETRRLYEQVLEDNPVP